MFSERAGFNTIGLSAIQFGLKFKSSGNLVLEMSFLTFCGLFNKNFEEPSERELHSLSVMLVSFLNNLTTVYLVSTWFSTDLYRTIVFLKTVKIKLCVVSFCKHNSIGRSKKYSLFSSLFTLIEVHYIDICKFLPLQYTREKQRQDSLFTVSEANFKNKNRAKRFCKRQCLSLVFDGLQLAPKKIRRAHFQALWCSIKQTAIFNYLSHQKSATIFH